jgi:hypothetical protein
MPTRRMKTYSAESGYVYQYYFVESRPLRRIWGAGGTAFRFSVSSDRKNYYEAEVAVEQGALEAWARAHGRALTDTEKYAAAKMRLFRAFDETSGAQELRRIRVDPANIESLLEPLRLDE